MAGGPEDIANGAEQESRAIENVDRKQCQIGWLTSTRSERPICATEIRPA